MTAKFIKITLVLLFLFTATIIAQESYYDGIFPESSTFISDLQTLIRSNYVKLSYDKYDENMIPGFYAHDNGDGTNSVFGVYSNYEYIYSGTFAWGTMSREHTWCYSWMPTHGSTNTEEYSDYHHLFPVEQNHANAVRSNHPFGIVIDTISVFGEAIYGTDINGHKVYEPRDEQKGDAARALFYMALKYNGIDGNDWSFNYLNNVILSNLSEAPEDVDLLLQWCSLDTPDEFEKARNEYIYNLQHNRNPFIDHPEYLDYIDFYTMTKKSGNEEPTGYLFFSEYVEGSSNNKALELVNTSDTRISFSLGNYKIQIFSNGNLSPSASVTLSGKIDANSVFVISNSSAEQAILDISDQTSGSVNFNGNDAIVLLKGSDTLDVIGQVGFNPGTGWTNNGVSTYNASLRRKNSVERGDTTASVPFDPSLEWIAYPKDNIEDLGNNSVNPVQLVSFSADVEDLTVKLKWETATEVNNYGFQVERKKKRGESEWVNIGFVEGHGNSNSSKNYKFIDTDRLSGRVSYRLKQIDIDGQYEYSDIIEVNLTSDLAKKFELNQNYPNPFSAKGGQATNITYVIARSGATRQSAGLLVQLKVYDALGREVATLVNKAQSPGDYSVKFNAENLPSGIYFYTLHAGKFVRTRKMILMK